MQITYKGRSKTVTANDLANNTEFFRKIIPYLTIINTIQIYETDVVRINLYMNRFNTRCIILRDLSLDITDWLKSFLI